MQKENLSLTQILFYLANIEEYLGRRHFFEDYTASDNFNPHDIISVQNEAKAMMEFVGLYGYTTIITYEKQKEDAGGTINLNDSKEVFIQIDTDLLKNNFEDNFGYFFNSKYIKDSVLCVLAHEICHKLLFTHGIYISDCTLNEIYTDLTTIYVGFGLLTINGCLIVNKESVRDYANNTTTTYTKSLELGYLTPRSYILAYIMMAKSFGVNEKNFSLTPQNSIIRDDYEFAKQEACRFHIYSKENIKSHFLKRSKDIALINKNIVVLRTILNEIEHNLKKDFEYLNNLYNRIIIGDLEKHPIAAMYAMNFYYKDFSKKILIRKLNKAIKKLGKKYSSPEVINEKIRFVSCPICGLTCSKKTDNNTISIRKCSCNSIFAWDAGPIVL